MSSKSIIAGLAGAVGRIWMVVCILIQPSADAGSTPEITNQANRKSIGLCELGMKVNAEFKGDAVGIEVTPQGASLRSGFQRLAGTVTAEGFWLESTSDQPGRLQVLARSLGRNGTLLAIDGPGTVSVREKVVTFNRPGLTEEYSVSVDGVRQDFVVCTRPAGSGPLRVELAVAGATAEASADGARLILAGSQRILTYNRLQVADATGRTLTSRMQVPAADRLTLVVEDDGATYPIRIDPTFSDFNWSTGFANNGPNGDVYSLAVSGTDLYVGGAFTSVGGIPATNIAKWNGTAWSALGKGINSSVRVLAVNGPDLYAGGSFKFAGGVQANGIAKWNGETWSALGEGVNNGSIIAEISDLAVSGTDLYVGGSFTKAGGVLAKCIAKWNGSAWSAVGAGGNTRWKGVRCLTLNGADLYAANTESSSFGDQYNLYKWDGRTWTYILGADGPIISLAASGTDLYFGGGFTKVNGLPSNYIAKWDGKIHLPLGSGMTSTVYDIAANGMDLYAGGSFILAGQVIAYRIAKWDGSSWSALGEGMDGRVSALAVSGTDLYAAGDFTKAGLTPSSRIAQTLVPSSQSITFGSLADKTFGDAPFVLTATASSGLPPSYSIVRGSASIEGRILTLTGVGTVVVRASQAGNPAFAAAAPVERSFMVKLGQSVTFGSLADKTFGDPPFTLTATASSGLPVVFSIVSGPAALAGNILTMTGLGTIVIRASQPGNLTAVAAVPVDRSFTVRKVDQSITFRPLVDRVISDPPFSLSAVASSGLDTVFSMVSGPATIVGNILTLNGAGTVVVRASQTGNTRFSAAAPVDQSFTVRKLDQLISLAPLPDKYLGDTPFTISAKASSGLPTSLSIVSGPGTITGTTLTLTGPGIVVVRATQAGNDIYAAAPSTDQSFTVKSSQSINFPVLADKVFGDAPFKLAATASLPPSFSIVSGPATIEGATITLTGAGIVVVRASQAGNDIFAAAAAVDRSFTVKLPQSIIFDALADRSFRDSPFVLTATTSSGLSPAFSVVSGPATLVGSTVTLSGLGNVVIRASQAGNATYAAAVSVERTFTVRKLEQSIIFGPLGDRSVSDAPFALTATANSGLQPSFSVVSGPAIFTGSTLILTGAGTVVVRASQVGNATYAAAAPVDQTFNVRKLDQSITFGTLSDKVLGSGPFTVTAMASSGLPTVISLVSGPATVTGSTLTLTGVGTVVVRASQPGNSKYSAAAHVDQTFTVEPNLYTPTSLSISQTYFYDNIPIGTVIAQLTAVDADVGDVITYSLVAGPGRGDISDRDNAKFSIVDNNLRTGGLLFNYETQRTLLIRIRATDLAGHSVERGFKLNLVDATPWASFQLKGGFTNSPSYVNVIFQLTNWNGNGINLPRQIFDQANTVLQIKENGVTISPTESFLQIKKIDQVPAKVRTILLIDNSFSVGANLELIKSAAKNLIDGMFDEQEIAVYSFSSGQTLVKNFTGKSVNNQQAIKTAIDTIGLGSPTTDLYGSIKSMLELPQWVESVSTAGIQTGFLIVLTDGRDTAGQVTELEVRKIRDDQNKKIFTIGLGAEIDTVSLANFGNAGYIAVAQANALAGAFAEIQESILDTANSYYWLNYASPKRGDFTRSLTVGLSGNSNQRIDGTLTYYFSSSGFQDVVPGVTINRNVNINSGVTNLSIANNIATNAVAFTILGYFGSPSYKWSVGNSNLVTIGSIGSGGSGVTLIPAGVDGLTTLTVVDIVNFYTNTIPLVIGAGVGSSQQIITFDPLSDRTIGNPSFNVVATASSGLPVSFAIVSGPATLTGSTVTVTGLGTVIVRASQPGNAIYSAAKPIDQSFKVTVNVPATIKAVSITSRNDKSIAVRFLAPPNYKIDIEESTDLKKWIRIQSLSSGQTGHVEYIDSATSASPGTFYRAIGQ